MKGGIYIKKIIKLVIIFSILIVCFANAEELEIIQLTGYDSVVIGSPVIAIAKIDSESKYSPSNKSAVVETIAKNTPLEIIEDRSYEWYFVKNLSTKKEGWIAAESILIPPEGKVNKKRLSSVQLEQYVQNFKSDTNYFVWTDINRQLTYVFIKSHGDWVLIKSLVCATGKNVSPSKRGLYKFTDRGEWFYSERLNSGAKYWIRYSGSYLFHSIAMDREQNIVDGVVGERRSSGCIRFLIEDIKWIFKNVPDGTAVYIH